MAKLRSTLTGLEIMSQSVFSLQAVFAGFKATHLSLRKLGRVISQRNDTWDGSILVWICSVIHDTHLNLQSGVGGAAANNTQTQWQCLLSTKHCLAPWVLFVVVGCSGLCSPTTKMAKTLIRSLSCLVCHSTTSWCRFQAKPSQASQDLASATLLDDETEV